MPKPLVNLGGGPGLLEVASYARRGPGRRDRFSPAQIGLIARTVHRAPEVMVKVLTRGGQDLRAVGRHLSYLSRNGELELEADDGVPLSGKGAAKALVEDWDLELDAVRRTADPPISGRRRAPKLVHKMIFSMPPGTPPQKVLSAVRTLAREECRPRCNAGGGYATRRRCRKSGQTRTASFSNGPEPGAGRN